MLNKTASNRKMYEILKDRNTLGPVHKRRPQSGRGGLSSADKGGSSDADVRTSWHKKLRIFRIDGVSARARRVELVPADILRTKGEGVNFSRFCADVFYRRPLILNH